MSDRVYRAPRLVRMARWFKPGSCPNRVLYRLSDYWWTCWIFRRAWPKSKREPS